MSYLDCLTKAFTVLSDDQIVHLEKKYDADFCLENRLLGIEESTADTTITENTV